MSSSNVASLAAERRSKSRQRVLLRGLACYDKGRQSFTCAIRDLNKSGARITVPKNRELPSDFYLIDMREQLAHEAKLVWYNRLEAGLAFLQTIPFANLTDPKLTYLVRCWRGNSSV